MHWACDRWTNRKQFEGDAKFFRCICHFQLVRLVWQRPDLHGVIKDYTTLYQYPRRRLMRYTSDPKSYDAITDYLTLLSGVIKRRATRMVPDHAGRGLYDPWNVLRLPKHIWKGDRFRIANPAHTGTEANVKTSMIHAMPTEKKLSCLPIQLRLHIISNYLMAASIPTSTSFRKPPYAYDADNNHIKTSEGMVSCWFVWSLQEIWPWQG